MNSTEILDSYSELISETIIKLKASLASNEQNIVKVKSLINIINNLYKSKSNSKETNHELRQIISMESKLAEKTINIMTSLDYIEIKDNFNSWRIYSDRFKEFEDTSFDLKQFENKFYFIPYFKVYKIFYI